MAAAAVAAPLFPNLAQAASNKGKPKRIVFFLQNQGFDPATAIPAGMKSSGSLAKVKLPDPIEALEPYKERLHIINGLHGTHTSPSHSAFFGALGGYRGSDGVPPSGPTIDYTLSKVLPETLLPHLCIGMDSLENMKAKPTVANLSASGAGQPIFMHSNPNLLYQMLFGGISAGAIRKRHEAQSSMFDRIEQLAVVKGGSLPLAEKQRYGQYVQGFNDINGLRERLGKVSSHLRRFAPEVDGGYANPKFETDWHDRLLDLGISALKSGITSVLTIGSGRGEIFGSWKGVGVEQQGHNLGHMKQPNNPIWIKIRQYNSRMLAKLVQELESVPEGSGTMMDNTVILYLSCAAEGHHSRCWEWPFVMIGDAGGRLKANRYVDYPGYGQLGHRTTSNLYTTLLHLAGDERSRFGKADPNLKDLDQSGPLTELMA